LAGNWAAGKWELDDNNEVSTEGQTGISGEMELKLEGGGRKSEVGRWMLNKLYNIKLGLKS
jgi:hypothetical protein